MICSKIVSMMVGVRVSSGVHIPHPSGKVTIYSLTVRIVFAENTEGNGHTEFLVCSLVRINVIQDKVKNDINMG